jgi:hypothetical protein
VGAISTIRCGSTSSAKTAGPQIPPDPPELVQVAERDKLDAFEELVKAEQATPACWSSGE